MKSPRWARALLRFLAPPHRKDDVVGDLEESHRARVDKRGWFVGSFLTMVEAVDVGCAFLWSRVHRRGPSPRRPSEVSAGDVLQGFGLSWLDFKLGFRMLVKHPGLTVVASLAIAFGVALGAGVSEFYRDIFHPTLPFSDADRIVEVRNVDVSTGDADPQVLHDFVVWKGALRSVTELGAFRTVHENLITEGGGARPTVAAEMTAAALALPEVPPALGRLLSAADEAPGAPDVVLLSDALWKARFAGDRDVVGRTVHLASRRATVIGVMPPGFVWPSNHEMWTPLRLDPLDYKPGESPGIAVVGRMAPDVSIEEAQSELSLVGARLGTDDPTFHERLSPEVIGYGQKTLGITGIPIGFFWSLNVVAFLALMGLVCGNVALLLFARTAAREGEIVIRSALGASRGRIVAQLFAEAFVLGSVAALLGVWGAQEGLEWITYVMQRTGETLPFWFNDGLSMPTVVGAIAFTLVATVVTGVVPALRLSGRSVQPQLQRTGTRGSGREFGRVWSVIIVAQVAVTVAFVPIVILLGRQTVAIGSAPYGFAAEKYLAAELRMTGGLRSLNDLRDWARPALPRKGFATSVEELRDRLEREPGVIAVTMADRLPGAGHPNRIIEVEGPSAQPWSPRGHRVKMERVAPGYFGALGVKPVSGRAFAAGDIADGDNVAVVNRAFARDILEGRSPIGRRFAFNQGPRRDAGQPNPGPWYRIVGLVPQIAVSIDPEWLEPPAIYIPIDTAAAVYPVHLAIKTAGNPTTFSARLRTLVSVVDPELLLTDARPLNESAWRVKETYKAWFWVVMGTGGLGILLATAGIYSTMAFTVARRTREIGIRVALGARRHRIVGAIFARAIKQIATGVAGGAVLIVLFLANPELSYTPRAVHAGFFAAYLLAMLAVCGLACMVPTRRALAVQPTEALRAEG